MARWPTIAAAGIVAALLALLLSVPARAGAWTQKRGDQIYVLTAGWHGLDPADGPALFKKQEIALYAEWGLTDRITLYGRLARQTVTRDVWSETEQDTVVVTQSALGGNEAGIRVGLFQRRSWASAIQFGTTFESSGENVSNAGLGQGGGDLEIRAMAGRSLSHRGFAEAQLAWRQRSLEDRGEVRLDLTAVYPVNTHLDVMAQTFSVWSMDTDPTRYRSFSGHRAQLSLLADGGPGRLYQLGVLATVARDGMADERALILGIAQRF
ncbi:hypothetical protein [Marinicauda sp. Alg238-R41]|uniref:hypothetical protein n=1 Tax=Marinicauda sp. Alg238-R41 TaxID=2993447 RepID=UPI0022DEC224|nr:hypothetical protein [Marinicauda sp. Alg238-R41]